MTKVNLNVVIEDTDSVLILKSTITDSRGRKWQSKILGKGNEVSSRIHDIAQNSSTAGILAVWTKLLLGMAEDLKEQAYGDLKALADKMNVVYPGNIKKETLIIKILEKSSGE